jgi:hypothetical protein
MYVSLRIEDKKAVTTSYMSCCHIATLRSAKVQNQISLTLQRYLFSGWGSKHSGIVFAPEGGQYLIYGYLESITS